MIHRFLRTLCLAPLIAVSLSASSVNTCVPATCGTENHQSNSTVRATTAALRARTYAARPAPSLEPRAATRTLPAYTGAFAIGGNGATLITAMAADSAGNTLVAGGVVGSATFPTSPSPTIITSSGDSDPFVAKFNAAGQCLWVRTARGITGAPKDYSSDGALALAVDTQNNVYIGGAFVRQLDFLNAGGQVVSTLYTAAGTGYNYEAFVARYDSNGTLTWAQGGMSGSAKGANLESGLNGVTTLVVDSSGNLFAGGTASGMSMLGAPVSTSAGGSAFIARLNSTSGTPVWINAWRDDDTEFYDGIAGLVSDQQGGVVALGFGYGSGVTFATAPSATAIPFDEDQIGFLARFNGNGQCLWARRPASSGYIDADYLAVTPLGQVVVSGGARGDAWFDNFSAPGPYADTYEAYITRYDASGAVQWVRSLLTLDGYSYATQLTVDAAGNTYFGGKYTGHTSITGNIDDGPGLVLAAPLDEDTFFAMYGRRRHAALDPRTLRSGRHERDVLQHRHQRRHQYRRVRLQRVRPVDPPQRQFPLSRPTRQFDPDRSRRPLLFLRRGDPEPGRSQRDRHQSHAPQCFRANRLGQSHLVLGGSHAHQHIGRGSV